MQLNLKLKDTNIKEKKTEERVKKAVKSKATADYDVTWLEVWETGYTTPAGKFKNGILQSKISDKDRERLLDLRSAIDNGEISPNVARVRDFTKAYAMRLYAELQELRREGIIADMVKNKPSNYILINEVKQFSELITELSDEELIAVDTETTGVEVWGDDKIVGISLSLHKADKHVYIPIRHTTGEKQLREDLVINALKPLLESNKIRKLFHNYKFDYHMLKKEGINVRGLYMDTMVAAHLLNENEPSYALKNLATKYGRYFGFDDKSRTYEELFGKGGFEGTPLEIGTVYACKDTALTLKYGLWIKEQFDRVKELGDLYFNVELPITEICASMESAGFLLDKSFAKAYVEELKADVKDLEADLNKYFGDINLNSPAQLGTFLYDTLGLKDVSGNKSVDKNTLEKLASEFEGVEVLLKYRKLSKLIGTYIEPLPSKVAKDGRLHGSFNQSATVTGRFASNNPNLQNLPYAARKMIIAGEDSLIIGIDFSQIEPRILAHMSNDADLQAPYLNKTDLYSTLASKVFKVPIEECGDGSKYRKMMKTGLLAVMYGTSMFTLAQQLKITVDEAEQFIKDFNDTYKDVAKFIQGQKDHADNEGYVQTLYGRKRRFLGHKDVAKRYHAVCGRISAHLGKKDFDIIKDGDKIPYNLKRAYWDVAKDYGRVNRMAVNSTIQGTGADCMKLSMVAIQKHLETKGAGWRLLATIHDEVLIEIPATATAEEVQEIADVQKNAFKLSIPVTVDVEVSDRWGEGVPFSEWVAKGCGKEVFKKGE